MIGYTVPMRFLFSSLVVLMAASRALSETATAPDAGTPPSVSSPLKNSQGCLLSGNGYLRVKIRGAVTLDVDLHNSELQCDGGARPDGSGIRISFAGPLRSDGRRLRMVFGLARITEGSAGRALPTNLTLILEGEERLFATRGDDKCTADEVSQERVGSLDGPGRTYRVVARGFCIVPVNTINNAERILISSFDFAGGATFEDSVP
jgi:hypothetical protein